MCLVDFEKHFNFSRYKRKNKEAQSEMAKLMKDLDDMKAAELKAAQKRQEASNQGQGQQQQQQQQDQQQGEGVKQEEAMKEEPKDDVEVI